MCIFNSIILLRLFVYVFIIWINFLLCQGIVYMGFFKYQWEEEIFLNLGLRFSVVFIGQ